MSATNTAIESLRDVAGDIVKRAGRRSTLTLSIFDVANLRDALSLLERSMESATSDPARVPSNDPAQGERLRDENVSAPTPPQGSGDRTTTILRDGPDTGRTTDEATAFTNQKAGDGESHLQNITRNEHEESEFDPNGL